MNPNTELNDVSNTNAFETPTPPFYKNPKVLKVAGISTAVAAAISTAFILGKKTGEVEVYEDAIELELEETPVSED